MIKLTHGGDIYSAKERMEGEIIDFSANINPLGLPDSVKKALMESMDCFSCYPDPICRELVKKIAKSEGTETENILCANGAADLIFRISQAIRPRNALLAVPTFSEYEQALLSIGCHIRYFNLSKENDFCLTEDFLEEIRPDTDLIFLCNPNNPTGQLIAPRLLEKILARCSSCGTMLVVDECFRDFLDNPQENSMVSWVSSFPNLMILRAFTKHYAMAGLRLGYCLCSNTPLLERMAQCGQPWSVSVPAQIAGAAALEDTDYLARTREWIQTEREYLKSELNRLGIKVIGSQANYLFFRLEDSETLPSFLEKKGILIRSCANYRGLDSAYYRIAVKSHKDNQTLVNAFTEYLAPEEEAEQEQVALSDEQKNISEEYAEAEQTEQPKEEREDDELIVVEQPDFELPQPDLQKESSVPPLSDAEQKKQYRFLRKKSKKYDWEGEE